MMLRPLRTFAMWLELRPVCWTAATLLALVVMAAGPSAADEPDKLHKPDKSLAWMDVFELEYASDPQVSPGGEQVVFVRNSMDVMTDKQRSRLWKVDTDGSNLQPLTSGDGDESHPRWSHDGTRVAYVCTRDGKSQLMVLWTATGQSASLAQLPSAPESLAWSYNNEWIAFTMLVPEKREPLVELPEKPPAANWADPPMVIDRAIYRADGQGYLKEGFRHVFVVPATGGTPRQLTTGSYHHNGPLAWSRDSSSLLFSANRNDDWEHQPRESEIYEVAVNGGTLKRLTRRDGPDETPAIAPVDDLVAFTGYDDQHRGYQVRRLYVMKRDGSDRRLVSGDFDRDVTNPVWDADGSGLYFQFDDQGTTRLGYITLDGEVQTVASNVGGTTLGRPYASGSFSVHGFSARGDVVAYTHSTPDHPADVAVVQFAPNRLAARPGQGQRASASEREIKPASVVREAAVAPRLITQLNADLFSQRALGETEMFWYQSSFDNEKMQGWIVKPPGFDPKKKYPLILEIHGGPFANYGDRFSMEVQLYAAAGYVVLYTNPRGSTGYGQRFADLIHHRYPAEGDFQDLMSGVDEVIGRGYVDPHRLYVTGGSGGGILTAWLVGKTGRFKAAAAQKPVINWYSFILTTDLYLFFTQYWFPGPPWEHAAHYLERSPLSLVGNVTTPTMLITGETDYRTPISESEQFYQALRLRKVDTMLVRVPEASHNIAARPSRMMMKVAYILKWFEKYGGELLEEKSE